MATTTTSASSLPFALPQIETRVRRKRPTPGTIVLVVLMVIFTLIWLVPLWGALITAVRTQGEITANGYWSIPQVLTLGNFGTAWVEGNVGRYLTNSFIVTIPSLIGMLFLSSMAAFALARYKFRGNLPLYFMFVAGTSLPYQILLLPVFYMAGALGMYNQYSALIVINTAFQLGFCTFVLRNFMRTIPGEILEAARMDGASEFRLYWQLMLPLSLPALAALATLEFTWVFNDYLWALILIRDGTKMPITVGLASLQGQYFTDWPVLTSGALIAALPTVFIFIFLQRYFIQGLTLGSNK
ncbi:MAG: carbohydrate ABC transporter permease [Aggregatilineales bacterium]